MRTSRPVVPLADGRSPREAVTKEGTGVRVVVAGLGGMKPLAAQWESVTP